MPAQPGRNPRPRWRRKNSSSAAARKQHAYRQPPVRVVPFAGGWGRPAQRHSVGRPASANGSTVTAIFQQRSSTPVSLSIGPAGS